MKKLIAALGCFGLIVAVVVLISSGWMFRLLVGEGGIEERMVVIRGQVVCADGRTPKGCRLRVRDAASGRGQRWREIPSDFSISFMDSPKVRAFLIDVTCESCPGVYRSGPVGGDPKRCYLDAPVELGQIALVPSELGEADPAKATQPEAEQEGVGVPRASAGDSTGRGEGSAP